MTDAQSPSSERVSFLVAELCNFRSSAAIYCRTEVAQEWGIDLPLEHGVRFHYVARGHCWLRTERMLPIKLLPGDLALLPHGTAHVIASSADGPARSLLDLGLEQVSEQEFRLSLRRGRDTSLIQCCTLSFTDPVAKLLIGAMPHALVLRHEAHRETALSALLTVLDSELEVDRPGADTIRARLADAAIGMILRGWAETSPDRPRWVRSNADPRILRALEAVHKQPGHGWSVVQLAKTAGMSRSTFIEAFTAMTGTTPGRFVTDHRMVLAARLLRDSQLSLAEIAAKLGYSGAPAFSRAFHRHNGRTPSSARRFGSTGATSSSTRRTA